jgi:HEAT repeat protein
MTLSALGFGRFQHKIADALGDASDLVAMQAARALAQGRETGYLPMILQQLHRYAAWSTGFLVSMLASFGTGAAPILRDYLADPAHSPRERAVAAAALQELDDYAAADLAADLAAAETDPELLAAALGLLGKLGNGDHLSRVRPHCQSIHPLVRAQAMQALGHLGGKGVSHILLAAMQDGSPWVRMEAAKAMKHSGAQDLLRALADSPDARASLAREVLENGS